MNNDVVVTPGWLERMIAVAKSSPRIGIVGPMSNHISGPQQVPPVQYNEATLAGLEDFAAAFARAHAGQSQHVWRVVGFCMLIKRTVIDKIGGLDERYGLGNFEDDDFSLRAGSPDLNRGSPRTVSSTISAAVRSPRPASITEKVSIEIGSYSKPNGDSPIYPTGPPTMSGRSSGKSLLPTGTFSPFYQKATRSSEANGSLPRGM